MEILLWTAIAVLLCIVAALSLKIFLMKKSVRTVSREFSRRLATDTNTLIDIPHQDSAVRELAGNINDSCASFEKSGAGSNRAI